MKTFSELKDTLLSDDREEQLDKLELTQKFDSYNVLTATVALSLGLHKDEEPSGRKVDFREFYQQPAEIFQQYKDGLNYLWGRVKELPEDQFIELVTDPHFIKPVFANMSDLAIAVLECAKGKLSEEKYKQHFVTHEILKHSIWNINFVRSWLDKGGDINEVVNGQTALSFAVNQLRLTRSEDKKRQINEVIDLLFERGAKLIIDDENAPALNKFHGFPVLDRAIAEAGEDKEALANFINGQGGVLGNERAVDEESLRKVLENGADVHARDGSWFPLIYCYENPTKINLLLERGAHIKDLQDNKFGFYHRDLGRRFCWNDNGSMGLTMSRTPEMTITDYLNDIFACFHHLAYTALDTVGFAPSISQVDVDTGIVKYDNPLQASFTYAAGALVVVGITCAAGYAMGEGVGAIIAYEEKTGAISNSAKTIGSYAQQVLAQGGDMAAGAYSRVIG